MTVFDPRYDYIDENGYMKRRPDAPPIPFAFDPRNPMPPPVPSISSASGDWFEQQMKTRVDSGNRYLPTENPYQINDGPVPIGSRPPGPVTIPGGIVPPSMTGPAPGQQPPPGLPADAWWDEQNKRWRFPWDEWYPGKPEAGPQPYPLPNGGPLPLPGGSGGGGNTGDIEAAIDEYFRNNPRDTGIEGLYNFLKSRGFDVERPTNARGLSNDKLVMPGGQVRDFIQNEGAAGSFAGGRGNPDGYWVNGKPSSTPGVYTPPMEGGGGFPGGGGWGTGGFGSGVFNFPYFQPPVGMVPPFQNPVPPMAPFVNQVPNMPDFQNPVPPMAPFVNQVPNMPDMPAPPPFVGPTLEEFRNTPGYQFARDEGLKAVDRTAASRGTLNTGGTLKAAMQYGTGLADQTYGDAWNRSFQANQANFQNPLAAYQATLQGRGFNFNMPLQSYQANLAGRAQNFEFPLGAYNATMAGRGFNFNMPLQSYNANLAGRAQNFSFPLQAWQANAGANAQNFNQALQGYNTNFNTGLQTHQTNFSDLYNLSSLGKPE